MLNNMSERRLYYYATQINLPQATQSIIGYCSQFISLPTVLLHNRKIAYLSYW
jgi:hypothetical protein